MQTDLHAGLKALTALGWTDPERVCVVGASYGGYAALAGAMTAPELFSCVVALAPVTDLPSLLAHERRDGGQQSYAYEYWSTSIGDPGDEQAVLKAFSPAHHPRSSRPPYC